MPVHNIRAVSQDISLDREGFRLVVAHSNVRNFYDKNEILRVYYPEAEQLLKEVTGATSSLPTQKCACEIRGKGKG